jgi:hypothetical protein
VRTSLEAYTTNDILVNDARLILQEEIAFKQRKVWRYGKKSFTQMHEDRDLENQIRVEVYHSDATDRGGMHKWGGRSRAGRRKTRLQFHSYSK